MVVANQLRDAYAHRHIHRYVLWKANDALDLYVSCVALGLSMGLSEAPILTYVGETVEPRLRGPLSSVSTFTIMLGSFVAYLMSTVLPWRTIALINISVPIVSFVAVVLLVSMACLHDSSWPIGFVANVFVIFNLKKKRKKLPLKTLN